MLVTVGGVATTDGGLPVVDVVSELPDAVDLPVACDVTTRFVDAARVFAPQKGATFADVEILTRRLKALRAHYLSNAGRDVGRCPAAERQEDLQEDSPRSEPGLLTWSTRRFRSPA